MHLKNYLKNLRYKKPNIVLIVLDAIRAQNMSCYGYERKTTPMLEEILPYSVIYKNAISPSYWTLPSHASMFTGTYLSKHGLCVDGDILKPDFVTIAELLKSKGYFTAGLCRAVYISRLSGLHRGFDRLYGYKSIDPWYALLYSKLFEKRLFFRYVKKVKGPKVFSVTKDPLSKLEKSSFFKRLFWLLTRNLDKGAKTINNMAFELIRHSKKNPFFIFIHYCEGHLPYIIPKTYKEKYLSSGIQKPWNVNQDHIKYFLNEVKMSKDDFNTLRSLYDGTINYLDERVFEIYSFLDKEKLLDDTMMIITSDHGDNLGEHNLMYHFWCLYDTLIKVPLIIKYPKDFHLQGEEKEKIVQSIDLLPTIMDILGVKDNNIHDQIQGNSLVSTNIRKRSFSYGISELMKPYVPSIGSYEYFKNIFHKYDRRLISIRTINKKYISSSSGEDEFYDLDKDPNECFNKIDSGDPNISELKRSLEPWFKSFNNMYTNNRDKFEGGVKKFIIETEMEARLKKLGYL